MQILTQDTITLTSSLIDRIRAQGPFTSFSEAARIVQTVVNACRPGTISDHTARQITVELMARSKIDIDLVARQVAVNACVAQALDGIALYPSIVVRLLKRGPFADAVTFEMALGDTLLQVFGTSARVSLVHALADDMINDGSIDLPHPVREAA